MHHQFCISCQSLAAYSLSSLCIPPFWVSSISLTIIPICHEFPPAPGATHQGTDLVCCWVVYIDASGAMKSDEWNKSICITITYLYLFITKRLQMCYLLMLWDTNTSRLLEMCKNLLDLPLSNVSVHSNFIGRHFDAETNYDPLDSFRDGLALRHGDGSW